MIYQLRDYQQKASDAAVRAFQSKSKNNGLLILPTGAGKSLVIADIASRLDAHCSFFSQAKKFLNRTLLNCKAMAFLTVEYTLLL